MSKAGRHAKVKGYFGSKREYVRTVMKTDANPGGKQIAVIIPVYNSLKTLPRLVESLKRADTAVCEILFVDDGSTDGSAGYLESEGYDVFRMPENSGPSAARNEGIRRTQAPLVLFADSDVVICSPDAFNAFITAFEANPDVNTVATISLPTPENDSFLSRYTALNEFLLYDRWIGNRPVVDPWPEISTRFGAYRRELLEAIGGFDTSIPIASVEDADLFYRIQEKGHHGVLLAHLKIGHHWPTRLVPLVKAWIVRARLWSRLFARRKTFDQVFATRHEALCKMLDCLAAATLVAGAVFHLLLLPGILMQVITMMVKIPMFIGFRKYHGWPTATGALFASQLNSISIGIGALAALLERIPGTVGKKP